MSDFGSYLFLAMISLLIIVSYVFNIIAKKTNIPSVLLLMGAGLAAKEMGKYLGYNQYGMSGILEILGIVGVIMIVLEAALDLKLSRSKIPLVFKSFIVATVILLITSAIIAFIISYFTSIDYLLATLYAIPLSVMSSAIIIPSVSQLDAQKKEFMIYESTFSDILGIIYFYLILDAIRTDNITGAALDSLATIIITLLAGIIISYLLVFLVQKVLKSVNYFLIFAILILLYSVEKMIHLSPLITILIFGITVNNKGIFFKGKLQGLIDNNTYGVILKNFKVFTIQSSFLVRTFFFFMFGMSISVVALGDVSLYIVLLLCLAAMYSIRLLSFVLFYKENLFPEVFLSPRGLITILLFFSIPEELMVEHFENDLIFMIIISTNIIMMIALMFAGKKMDDVKELTQKTIEKPNRLL